MFSKSYSPLRSEDEMIEEAETVQSIERRTWCVTVMLVLSSALVVSLILNLLSYKRLIIALPPSGGVTEFAGLLRNTQHTIQYRSQFNNPDRDAEDAAWASDLVNPSTLVVALEDSFTEPRGVLHSMRWPWDSSKGVYTLNSAHELHCLHLLRKTVNQAYDDVPLQWPREHTAHCLEYLLQSIMCNADDTPLYQGRLHENHYAEHPIGGLGDTKMCRDWNQLRAWAEKHSACYNQSYRMDDASFPEKERYKFCPDDRKPWEES